MKEREGENASSFQLKLTTDGDVLYKRRFEQHTASVRTVRKIQSMKI